MSLLLKSLRQIGSRAPLAEAAAELEAFAVAAEVLAAPTLPVEETVNVVSESPIDDDLDKLTDGDAIVEQSIADVLDPIDPTPPSMESIPIDALFPPADEPVVEEVELSPPLLMTSTVNETGTDDSKIAVSIEIAVEATLEHIRGLDELLTAELDEAQFVEVVDPLLALTPAPVRLRTVPMVEAPAPVAFQSPINASASLKLNEEFRELRDHLLSRYPLQRHSMLMLISAGRTASDVSWAIPFAASLLEHLRNDVVAVRPTALLVEFAGARSGLSKTLGLETAIGLGELLSGKVDRQAAIQATVDSQIRFLAQGSAPASGIRNLDSASVWADLKEHFDLIVVAAGPAITQSSRPAIAPAIANLLPQIDGAILCVELDGTPQSIAVDAKRILTQQGVNLLGCVLHGDAAAA